MLPSASLGEKKGLYEPVHGSAPDIAGQNKANPLGAIGSVAAMLEYTFGLMKEANAVNDAIGKVLESGKVTADLRPKGKPATTDRSRPGGQRGIMRVRNRERSSRRFGTATWWRKSRERPRCSTSICISPTKSPRRRLFRLCASAVSKSAGRI